MQYKNCVVFHTINICNTQQRKIIVTQSNNSTEYRSGPFFSMQIKGGGLFLSLVVTHLSCASCCTFLMQLHVFCFIMFNINTYVH